MMRKTRLPAVTAVAAKWTARITTMGPSSRVPNQSMAWSSRLRADLKRETAVSGMGVYREHMPGDVVGSAAPRPQRDRDLAAADADLAVIDALARGIGDGDGAEGRLQLLCEPKRHFSRRGGHGIADARLGAVEHGMGRCFGRGEQQQQRDQTRKRYAAHGQFLADELANGLAGPGAGPKIGLPIPRGSMSSR